jgi:WD40 repeat protein
LSWTKVEEYGASTAESKRGDEGQEPSDPAGKKLQKGPATFLWIAPEVPIAKNPAEGQALLRMMVVRARWAQVLFLILVFVLPGGGCRQAPDRGGESAPLRLAVFSSDATPPLGHPLYGGGLKPNQAVDEPLKLRGVVLSDGTSCTVLSSLDWCRLQTGAYDLFRRKIARAAGTFETRVAVQCVHAHDAPIADTRAQELLQAQQNPPRYLDLDFMEAVTDRAASAVKEALTRLRPFTHVGYGKGKVEEYASSRRPILEDGRVHTRFSQNKDPVLHDAPEGMIDPWVRTITLFDGETPLVRMHYYASHLQNNHGRGRADPDIVGPLLGRLEREEGVPQIYFAGCGGDVTAGKYNLAPPAEMKARLIDRMVSGIRMAIQETRRIAVSGISWKTTDVQFALRQEPEFSLESFRRELVDPTARPVVRFWAALAVAWHERLGARPGVDLGCLRLGPVYILHLPGEAFVEYQLFAQHLRPADFVAVAACGEGGPGYVCTDRALDLGGYEPTQSLVGAPTEVRLKKAIAEALDAPADTRPGVQESEGSGVSATAQPEKVGAHPWISRLSHPAWVTCAAFSPDGKALFTGDGNGTLREWDLSTGAELHKIERHQGPVWSIALSPDGKRLASGGRDRSIRFCEVPSGEELAQPRRHRGEIWVVAFSPDGKWIASGGDDRALRLWDTATARELFSLEGGRAGVTTTSFTSLAFSPDGKMLAAAGVDGTIFTWSMEGREELLKIQWAHRGEIWSMALSPDGRLLASAGYDGTIRLRDSRSGKEERLLEGHRGWVTSLAFSPDGGTLASGGQDRTIRLWNTRSGNEERRLEGHRGLVTCVAFSPEGKRLASTAHDGAALVWRIP